MKTRILARRLHLVVVPESDYTNTPIKQLTFCAELAKIGYSVTHQDLWNDSVLRNYDEILTTLLQLRGADVDYVPLFQGFPDRCPDPVDYQVQRLLSILAHLGSASALSEQEWNLTEFGALPVSQRQTKQLYDQGVARQVQRSEDSSIAWIEMELVDPITADQKLQDWVVQQLTSRSSIKTEIRDEVEWTLNYFALEGNPISVDSRLLIFKENRTFLSQFYWERGLYQEATKYLQTPTDCLRLLAAVADSDVSLSENITFPKLNRSQRRTILSVLERCPALAENLQAYRGLWIAVGNYLHPGEYKSTYPKTADAFSQLRQGKIVTFNSRLEQALAQDNWQEAVQLLSQRPGLFARRLHQLLSIATGDQEQILEQFLALTSGIPLKNLLVMERYFATINESPWRGIVNKKGKLRVLAHNPDRTTIELNHQVVQLLHQVIITNIQQKYPSWQGKKVWIDPTLKKVVLPLQERAGSRGTLSLARGARIALTREPVLRLFVYWKQQQRDTDLDLSVLAMDETFNYVDQVSYTNLSSKGIQHSGDIQSAPQGAAEFIDINLATLNPQWRYIAAVIFRFRGEKFDQMTCHCGWMMRSLSDSSTKVFDAKTVQSKVDLNSGKVGYAIPIMVDLECQEIIYTDLYVKGTNRFNRVEEAGDNLSMVSEQIARFYQTRPTLADLAIAHLTARQGIPADSPEEADITFGWRNCTYNQGDAGKILSELL